jgi:hypothetical protein
MRRWLILVAMLGLAGCKGASGRAAGQPCTASSECGPGLVCDFNQATPVCASMLSPGPPDAAPGAADAPPGPDAPQMMMIDAAPGTPDAHVTPPADAPVTPMIDAPVTPMIDAMPPPPPIDAATTD